MWGKDKSKKVDFDRHAGKTTMIAHGTKLTGNISFTGGLLVEGIVEGNVAAEDSADALLRLSEAGLIKGEIRVPNVVINGKVTGDVYSSGHVELAAKAVVNGNVHYNLIEMVMGAEVNGSLVHDQSIKPTVSQPSIDVAAKPRIPMDPAPVKKQMIAPDVIKADPPKKPRPDLQPGKSDLPLAERLAADPSLKNMSDIPKNN